ncbi:MAG TPA: hypothetical protein VM074_13110 [Solimonas sp.]|nr:hypothetical protein [Solimonas sp.]
MTPHTRCHIAGLALIAPIVLAACGQGFGDEDLPAARAATSEKLYAGEPLWRDPQNTPHPMFNWPTLSSPPQGKALPEYWAPIPARTLPQPIMGLEHVAQVPELSSGAGIAVFGSLAVVPGFGSESAVVDLSDPQNPRVLSYFGPGNSKHGAVGTHRGAAFIAYPDGRLATVISTDTSIEVWDLSNPAHPRRLPSLHPVQGSHKVGVVPGTPIVYNAASAGGGTPQGNLGQGTGVTEIFDLSDPDHPVHVQDFANGYSCHHVYFWNNLEQHKYRAICAGVEFTQIWDTTDPRNPQVIVSVPFHHGVPGAPSAAVAPEAFSHYAGLSMDGTVLLVGDENGGGSIPPGCLASVSTPAGDPGTPVGAVWFYDVTDETQPLLQGWYSAANDPLVKSPAASCTAHHGRLVPDPDGRDLLAMSFYGDGVILIDFTLPTLPHAVAQFVDGSNTWETWYHNGYLITGDLSRGMDVLTFR